MLGKAREELVEMAAGELPGKRLGHLLVASLEGDEAFGQSIKGGEVIGSENLTLNHREVDLDLVEPGSVSRKMDESQVGPPPLKTLHRGDASVGGTIVHHPEDPTGRGVGFLLHHLLDEAAKRLDADLRLATSEEPGAMDVPGGQVGQGSLASVLVFDAHLPIFARWKGRMASSESHRQTVAPEISATMPRSTTSRATSSVLQRLKGTPLSNGSSQAMAFTSILTEGGKGRGPT